MFFKYLLIGGLLLLCMEGKTQNQNPLDTLALYEQANNVPRAVSRDPQTLATFLTKGYQREDKKVLVISYWITKHIQFNYPAFKQRLLGQKTSIEVLQSRKALCREYAQLFKEMCGAVGVQAGIVNGYTKGFDFFSTDTLYRAEHAWSIVRIDGVWHLMDLTYASGHIEPQKQTITKVLLQLFDGNLAPKFKYVHAFNPDWLYVSPDELIFTHFPNLKMYQLLKEPLSLQVYQEGGWLIHGHLSWYPKMNQESIEVDRFMHLSNIEQWLYEAKEAYVTNPKNHSVKGQHYYFVLDSLFRAAYDQQSNGLIASKPYLKQMEDYARMAELALHQSIQDNNQEYENKNAQSWAWKKRLFDQNKAHVDELQQRSQKNVKQESLVLEIEKNNLANQDFTGEQLPSKNNSKETKEQGTDTLSAYIQFNAILQEKLDSLDQLAIVVLEKKNACLQSLGEGMKQIIFSKEKLVLRIHRGNAKALKQIIDRKKIALSLVYEDPEILDKQWLAQSNQRADSINGVVIDPFLLALYQNQIASHKAIKSYCQIINAELHLLQKEKQKLDEHSLAEKRSIAVLTDLETQLIQYQVQLKDCLGFQQKLTRLLGNEVQQMENSIQTLVKDNRLEHYRHLRYMEYRQKIRQTENAKVNLVLQKIAKIKRSIDLAQS